MAGWTPLLKRSRLCSLSQGRMQAFPSAEEGRAHPVEIQTVINLAPISNATVFADDAMLVQFAQVIRNQVLGLFDCLDQLLDVQVSQSKRLEQLPADSVPNELQEFGWIDKGRS